MIEKLLKNYEKTKKIYSANKLRFVGAEGFDVYNVGAEFSVQGKRYILGRVEKRDSEISRVWAFELVSKNVYERTNGFEIENYQDPCIAKIGGELIIGGTGISVSGGGVSSWRTTFYRGKTLDDMRPFAKAPEKMKDVRLVEVGGRIGIFTRPQGGIYAGGKIGYTEVQSLDSVSVEAIESAKILPLFDEGEWGGANEVHVLQNGLLGVLGHIACFSSDGARHYYPMTFALNPASGQVIAPKIIARRDDLPTGESKRDDLKDVLFSGGLVRSGDGRAVLYTGVSDAEAHAVEMDDPFLEYEAEKRGGCA